MTRLAKLIVFLGCLRYIQGSASCKSSDGKEVDWFIIYKIPKLPSDGHPSGTEFFYMDTASPWFSFSQKDITKSIKNPLYETLKALYDQSPDIVTYAMYNDQPPPTVKAADGRHAHSKGFLAFDKTEGFWIVSSVRRFPSPVMKIFMFSDSQTKFGQSILCVTVAKKVQNILKTVFETTNPYIYDKENFNIHISNPMKSVHIPIKTFGNVQLEILAKSALFGKGNKLADPLLVRTWRPNLLETALVPLNLSNVDACCVIYEQKGMGYIEQ